MHLAIKAIEAIKAIKAIQTMKEIQGMREIAPVLEFVSIVLFWGPARWPLRHSACLAPPRLHYLLRRQRRGGGWGSLEPLV